MRGAQDGDPAFGATCHSMITSSGAELLERASRTGAIRPGVAIVDLLKLANAIAMATEREPDGAAEAGRLLTLALNGVHQVT